MSANHGVVNSDPAFQSDGTGYVQTFFPSCALTAYSYESYLKSSPIIGMCVMGFDTLLGPVMWAQWPLNFISDDAFREISDKLVSGDEFASIPLVLHISKDTKYHRNAFFFSIALFVQSDCNAAMYIPVLQTVAEFLINIEKNGGRQAGRTKKAQTKEDEHQLENMRTMCLCGIFELQLNDVPLLQCQNAILTDDGMLLKIDCTHQPTPYTVDLSDKFDKSMFLFRYLSRDYSFQSDIEDIDMFENDLVFQDKQLIPWNSAKILHDQRIAAFSEYQLSGQSGKNILLDTTFVPGCDDLTQLAVFVDYWQITPVDVATDALILGIVEQLILESLVRTLNMAELHQILDIALDTLQNSVLQLHRLGLVIITIIKHYNEPLVLQPTTHWCKGECMSTLCETRIKTLCRYVGLGESSFDDIERTILTRTAVTDIGWKITWASIASELEQLVARFTTDPKTTVQQMYIFLLHTKVLAVYRGERVETDTLKSLEHTTQQTIIDCCMIPREKEEEIFLNK